jgi:predicted component of type VI protein secretion system
VSTFRNIEQRLEGLFERGFRRAFRSQLQPVELARKLAREMDNNKTVSVSRVYGPNEFHVFLSPEDRETFGAYETALVQELETYLSSHARTAGLTLVARPVVLLETDDELRAGEFGISSRMDEHVPDVPIAAQMESNPFDDHISEQPPAPSQPVAPANPVPAPPAEQPVAEPTPAPTPAPSPAPTTPPPAEPVPAANAALAGVSGTQVLPAESVRAAAASQQLWLEFRGERHLVADTVTTLGRSRGCDIVIGDPNVSRKHAEIRRSNDGFQVIDLGSTNGIEANGRQVGRHDLVDGDDLLLGATHIRIRLS